MLETLLSRFTQSGRTGTVVALYGEPRAAVNYQRVIDIVLNLAANWNLPKPDWISAVGKGFGGGGMKFEAGLKRLNNSGYVEIDDIEFNSAIPGDDNRFTGWVWYTGISRKYGMFTLCVENAVYILQRDEIIDMVTKIYPFFKFGYGYAHEMDIRHGIMFYVAGIGYKSKDVKDLSRIETEERAKWGNEFTECRKQGIPLTDNLRDIYPINFVSEKHLGMSLSEKSLGEWIVESPTRGTLTPLINGLYVWEVPSAYRRKVRHYLGKHRLLVSYGDYKTPSGGIVGHVYGPHHGKTVVQEKAPFKDMTLGEAEKRWIAEGLILAKPIFEYYTGRSFDETWQSSKGVFFPTLLDMAFKAWIEDMRPNKATDPESAAHAFAVAFGEYLVKDLHMEWESIGDDKGRYVAVVHRPSRTRAHPLDSVQKRIDQQEWGFFATIYEAVQGQIKKG